MKNILTTLVITWCITFSFGQDYKSQFEQFLRQKDTVKQLEVLTQWEAKTPKNPELFTSYFNYYFLKSRKEYIAIKNKQTEEATLQIQDSTGQAVGYFGNEFIYDKELIKKGLAKIEEGIALYPNRLDMRFGKIYTLGQIKDWENFTNEIVKTVRYSKTNNNQWTWTFNETRNDAEKFFLSALQDYQTNLFDTHDDRLLGNIKTIAEEILKIYPNHIESLSNIAVVHLLHREYEKAINILLKAEKINPKDGIILGNIAQSYYLMNNKVNAIEYYEKMLHIDDPKAAKFAKQQMNALKNKDEN